ncbi:MAG: magnesium/cobalt efflux protein [Gammaproteobacteria bacterium]|nr:MAG: magnesium/cobalt efflux protein [Gammaproteobacteria bacterium]
MVDRDEDKDTSSGVSAPRKSAAAEGKHDTAPEEQAARKEDDRRQKLRSIFDRLSNALGGEPRDRDELLETLRDAQARQLFDADTLQMVEGVFQVIEMQVRDIMIPRGQMVVIEKDAPLERILPLVIESGHSRFPVIDEDRDDVVGVLLAKDLLRFSGESEEVFHIEELLRETTVTPETKRLNVLLKEFRTARNHMAIVLDEYGGVAGLVTIEDVLEEIVGEIDDEHDTDEDADMRVHGDGRYSVNALTPIADFNAALGTDFSDEEFDTIGGVLLQHIGHMPKPGEVAVIKGCRFQVLASDSRRLQLLQVSKASE